jgi:phosphoglycolate phosphatase
MRSRAPTEQIIFDFDGVILDSADLKTRAFAQVYAGEDPAKIAQVVEYQELHGGVGRVEKFAHFERQLFGRPGGPEAVASLCESFAAIVDEAMRRAEFIAGARALLDFCLGKVRMHVVSGMPHEDLKRIVAERGLGGYFDLLYGTPTTKLDAFRAILERTEIAPGNSLAIGDSLTEFEAATQTGVPFLAVITRGRKNRFPVGVPVVEDMSLAAVEMKHSALHRDPRQHAQDKSRSPALYVGAAGHRPSR